MVWYCLMLTTLSDSPHSRDLWWCRAGRHKARVLVVIGHTRAAHQAARINTCARQLHPPGCARSPHLHRMPLLGSLSPTSISSHFDC
jgi:hypothetical protein